VLGKFKTSFLFGLHGAALLPKHRAKDQDTIIKQSFICIYQQINGSAV